MARFCEKHMARAVDTLVSKKDGTEYDLCQVCCVELAAILNGESELSEAGSEKINEALKEVTDGQQQSKRGRKANK